jgi:hypothetical protein
LFGEPANSSGPGSSEKKIELFANGTKRRLYYEKGFASKILSNQKMAGLSYFSTGLPERGMDSGNGHTHLAPFLYHMEVSKRKTQ